MNITAVDMDGRNLRLSIGPESTWEAQKLCDDFKPGNYELKKSTERRSLNANAYCWVLCREIGKALGISKNEVYRNAINEGNCFVVIQVPQGVFEHTKTLWEGNGLGWLMEVEAVFNGIVFCHAYYGSSVYTKAEMAALIDSLVQECENIGIDTLSERERSLLLDEWN